GPPGCAPPATSRPTSRPSRPSPTATSSRPPMLIYGDAESVVDPRLALYLLAEDLERAAREPRGMGRHGALVGALVRAGELAQGLCDADFELHGADRRTRASDTVLAWLTSLAGAALASWQ